MNLRLADQLAQRGWIVDVAFLFDRYDASFYAKSYPALRQIHIRSDSRMQRFLLPIRLARLARSYQVVLAGLDLAATNYGYLAALIARKPFVSWMHTAFKEHSRSLSALSKFISLQVYRHISHIVFPSAGSRDSLFEILGGKPPQATWHIIKNFYTSEPIESCGSVRLKLPFRDSYLPIVLSIGRLSESKAYERLVRIHAELLSRGIKHCLVILGEGPERQKLEALAIKLGVKDTFFLPGHVSNTKEWLSEASVFALSSLYEGMPLVLIEAQQVGTPIASMDCPSGPREILNNGEVGFLVPRDDEISLANAIARLLEDPDLRRELSERGKVKSKEYDPIIIIPEWENIFRSLIDWGSEKS